MKRQQSTISQVRHEYFDGLGAQFLKNADEVAALVEAGKAKSGALLVHGTLSTTSKYHPYQRLSDLVSRRRVRWVEYAVVRDGLKREIERQRAFIDSLNAQVAA